MTNISRTTLAGQTAVYITCDCEAHVGDTYSAVITGATADALEALTGQAQAERIHYLVLLANHTARPLIRANERRGIFATGVL